MCLSKEWMKVIAKAQPGLHQYGKSDVHMERVIGVVVKAQPGHYQYETDGELGEGSSQRLDQGLARTEHDMCKGSS
jgi:hypothetical protein